MSALAKPSGENYSENNTGIHYNLPNRQFWSIVEKSRPFIPLELLKPHKYLQHEISTQEEEYKIYEIYEISLQCIRNRG